MYEICAKTILERTFMCTPSFPVCACLTTCVQEHQRTTKRKHWSQANLHPGSPDFCSQQP